MVCSLRVRGAEIADNFLEEKGPQCLAGSRGKDWEQALEEAAELSVSI